MQRQFLLGDEQGFAELLSELRRTPRCVSTSQMNSTAESGSADGNK